MSLDLKAKQFVERKMEFEQKYSNFEETKIEETFQEEEAIPYNDKFVTARKMWEDIVAKLNTNQFFALSALGTQGSGKSTLGKEFAELAMESGYKFIYALPDDFINDIDGWCDRVLEERSPINSYCVMLDDLSYSNDMQSRKAQAQLKNVVARVRHRFEGKVFIIYVTHRLHAAPPMLRNSGSWIFTEMQSADRDDALEVIGKNKELRERLDYIYTFLNTQIFEGAKKGFIKYRLDDRTFKFRWGSKENAGDGRLMAIYHAGQLGLYNAKLLKNDFNVNDYRYEKPEVEEAE